MSKEAQNNAGKFVQISEASRYYGVSNSTMRRWAKDERVEWKMSPTGRRLFHINKKSVVDPDRCVIYYTRVSTQEQKGQLLRQKEHIVINTPKHIEHLDKIFCHDVAENDNFTRKSFSKILEKVKQGKVHAVIVSSRDVLVDTGFELLEWLCSSYDTKILVVDDDKKSEFLHSVKVYDST